MAEEAASQQAAPKEQPMNKTSLIQNAEWGFGGVFLGLGFFSLVFFILNYFNILPLSQLYPNQLGFLPHRPYEQKQSAFRQPQSTAPPSSFESVQETTKPVMPCPTSKEFCLSAHDISVNGIYAGFGGNPVNGSDMIAVFDGTVSGTDSIFPKSLGKEQIAALYLDKIGEQLRAVYYYKGTAPKAGDVKKGDIIGKVGQAITTYDNVSLLFQLIKGDVVKGERLKLNPEDFTE